MVLFLILFIATITFFIRKPAVQTRFTSWVTTALSDKLQSRVSIGYVDIDFFNTIIIRDLLLFDRQQDTLLFTRELRVDISLLSILDRKINIEAISLREVYIGMLRKKGMSDFNYEFIAEAFSSNDTTSGGGFNFELNVNYLQLIRSRFNYYDYKNALDLHIEAPEISAQIDSMNIQKPFFALKEGLLESPVVKIKMLDITDTTTDSDVTDTAMVHLNTKSFGITTEAFKMKNARFIYDVENAERDTTLFDYRHMNFSDLNIITGAVQFVGDSITGNLLRMSCKEQSGLQLDTLKGDFRLTPYEAEINNMVLRLPNSRITDYAQFYYYNFPAFYNFNHDVKFRANIKKSVLDLRDIACFSTYLNSFNEPLFLSGNIRGNVSEFKGKNISLSFGKLSKFEGDITMIGLPDFDNTFIDFIASNVRSNYSDLNTLTSLYVLPKTIQNMGTMSFNGTFTGFVNDFVAYGALQSDLGTLISDLNMKNIYNLSKTRYIGTLSSPYFNLGKLSGADSLLGKVSFYSRLSGSGLTATSLDASVIGVVTEFDFNHYRYKNIDINGAFHQQEFTGRMQVDDENANLDFIGTVNWSEVSPQYNFRLTLNHANLKPLQFSNRNYTLSSLARINASGDDIDELQGSLRFDNIVFKEGKNIFQLDTASLFITKDASAKHIIMASPIMQVSIDGKIKMLELYDAMMSTIAYYFPSLPFDYNNIKVNDAYIVTLKTATVDNFLNYFFPEWGGFNHSNITLNYQAATAGIQLTGIIPSISYGSYKVKNIQINSVTEGRQWKNIIKADKIFIQDSIQVEKPLIEANLFNDSAMIHLYAKDDINNSFIDINSIVEGGKDSIQASFYKSNIVIRNEKWDLNNHNRLLLGNKYLRISDLQLATGNQSILIFTNNAQRKTNLHFVFNNLNAGNFYRYIRIGDNDAGGIIDGTASVLNIFDAVRFQSDFVIRQFYFNGDSINKVNVKIGYDADKDEVILSLKAKDTKYDFEASGNINPSASINQLNIHLEVLKFRLGVLEKYLSEYISSVSGIAAGALDIKGTIEKPLVFGKLNIPNCGLKINYLQTEYFFNDEEVTFYESSIDIDEIILHDKFNNTAILGGDIAHNNLNEFRLNLYLTTQQFNFLNTNARDNELFYGQAFAGGIVTFKGPIEDLEIYANVVSKPNTNMSIPITDENSVSENQTIRIINTSQNKPVNPVNDDYVIRLNFDLELTTDANIKIIFDQKAGDIINGTGKGNLRLEINTNGDFNMYGNYTIEQGDYLFTLQNFINKKFAIGQGGTITWSGDPYEAKINIDAIYAVQRTTISDLLQGTGAVLSSQDLAEANQKIPVNVYMNLSGSLMQPNIAFDIRIPSGFSSVGSLASRELDRLKQDPNELNKQVFGLLIMNRFLPANIDAGIVGSGVNTSVSEFLFNQLSYWASQNKFNIGVNVNYNAYSLTNDPTNDIRRRELIVGLQKSLFNDRLTVGAGGNFDVSSTTSNNVNRVAADVNVQYKLTRDGRYVLSAYNKSQYDLLLDANRNKRGVSIAYRKEFDNFNELFNREKK
jgi:hypothetical protein